MIIIDILLARLIKKKREKTKINKIRSEKGGVITDNTEIQRIVRSYYEQLYPNNMNNLGKIGKFLEKYSLPKLNQDTIENMNRPITDTEIKTIIIKKKSSSKQRLRDLQR